MSSARAGDVVRIEPGVYRERVMVLDGVDLAARIPGTVTVGRPPDANGEVVGITAFGSLSSRISGIRVESTPELPMEVGVRVADQGRTLELLDVSGPMHAGIELLPDSAVTLRGSLLTVLGTAMTLGDRSQATLVNNALLHIPASATTRNAPVEAPISMTASAQATLTRNVFAGYGPEIVKGADPAARQQMLAGNFVVAAQPAGEAAPIATGSRGSDGQRGAPRPGGRR
ncbi:MAG: hypothetical protein ABJC89_08910, partial [Acidobacteriota bacterium]